MTTPPPVSTTITGAPDVLDAGDVGADPAGAADAAQAYAIQRAHHTGSQPASSISDLGEAVQDVVGAMLVSGGTLTLAYDDAAGTVTVTGTGADAEAVRDTIGAALVGVNGVTVALNDAADTITLSISGLAIGQVTGLQTTLDGKVPQTRTLAGLDLSANRSAQDLVTALGSVLSASYGPTAAGSTARFVAALDAGLEDQALMLFGDSRGNEQTEWFGILATWLGTQYPAYTVVWNLWNNGSQTWDSPVTIQTGTGSKSLNVWNCSVGGTLLDYPAGTRLATWLTKQPDLLFIAYDTNETTVSSNFGQQRDRVLAITEQVLAASPLTSIVLIGGPQDFSESDATAMYERGKRTRQAAKVKGYGFIDVYKAFVDYGAGYQAALYNVDGIHPNATGEQLWTDEVKRSFRHDRATQPTPQPVSSLTEPAVNLFGEGDLRGFDGTAATLNGWTVPAGVTVSKDTTHKETKGYGVRFQSSIAGASPYKDIDVAKYAGKWVTVCLRTYVPTGQGVDVGRPLANDFVTSTNGVAYPAAQGSFVWQTVSKRLDSAATLLRCTVHTGVASGGDVTVDRIMVAPGILPRDLPTDLPSTVDVQTFTANGTWTKPTGAKRVHVRIVSGGGGGGSGRRGAAGSTRYGGGGAGGASAVERIIPADALTSTVAITVGAGGAGGAAVTADDTSGNDGSNGAASTFGAFARSTAGLKGTGGTAAAGTNGAGALGIEEGANGGAGNSGIGVTGLNARGAGGGGGGGGIGSGNLANAGGTGGYSMGSGFWNNAAGGVIDTTVPGAGNAQPSGSGLTGNGGGGGASSITTAAQAGAAGGIYGGGGGGGGASVNGSSSGAGGAGANGIVIVTTYF